MTKLSPYLAPVFFCLFISVPGHARFTQGWSPTGLLPGVTTVVLDENGAPLRLNDNMQPEAITFSRGLSFTPVRSEGGGLTEMQKDGKVFIKVEARVGSTTATYWLQKIANNFQFSHPRCEYYKESGVLLADSQTKDLFDTGRSGAGNFSSSEMSLKLRSVDCRQDWLESCIQDQRGDWIPAWVPSNRTHACQGQRTEAGVPDVNCTDCDSGELSGQLTGLGDIARRAREQAQAQYTRFVPENIHEIATNTAKECRYYAPYLIRRLDESSFLQKLEEPNSRNPAVSQEQVNQCRGILRECFGNRCPQSRFTPCYEILRKCNMPGRFTGWCLRGVRETLTDLGMIPAGGWLGSSPTSGATSQLENYGFENKIQEFRTSEPPYFQNLPPGAVVIYQDPTDTSSPGHAEIFTGAQYCSDFCSSLPISSYRSSTRQPIGIYIQTSRPFERN